MPVVRYIQLNLYSIIILHARRMTMLSIPTYLRARLQSAKTIDRTPSYRTAGERVVQNNNKRSLDRCRQRNVLISQMNV